MTFASRIYGIAGAALIGAFALIGAARAEDPAPIDSFYGRFVGGAEIKGAASSTARRESEIEIVPTEAGFEITWTTLSLAPDEPDGIKIKTAIERFKLTATPHIFEGESSNDPTKDGHLIWANIKGKTLVISMLTIEDGEYNLASYERTMVDKGHMNLVFTRFQGGEITRRVTGELTKVDVIE